MLKNYRLKGLLSSLAILLVMNAVGQVKFKVELLADGLTYQVSLYSEVDYPTAAQDVTTAAQITLTAPTGGFRPGAISSLLGNWSVPDIYVNPIVALDRDYFIFTLSNIIDDLNYQEFTSYPLFTFINEGACTGALEIMDNASDPFAEYQNIATKNFITIFGNGIQSAYDGIKDSGSAPCTLERANCELEFILEASAAGYRVSLLSDTTLTAPNNFTSSSVVTLRVPTGGFTVNDITNAITGVVFELTAVEINPSESPGYDYLFFTMDNPNLAIPYVEGDTVELFSFDYSGCVGDSIYLVGEGAAFPTPTINGESATSYLFASGFGLEGAPLCVSSEGIPICTLPPAPRDTLHFVLSHNDTATVCIDSALQLPNYVGAASICTQGSHVIAVLSNADSCLTLQPQTDFSGKDTLCVIYCDGINTTYCDTSILIVTVEEPTTVPEPASCVINYAVELDSGKYRVSLLPDTTWPAFPSGLTRELLITFRVPTGQLDVANLQNANGAVMFEVSNTIINPVETPGYDYISFSLINIPNPSIPYVKGQKVDLFSFENLICSLDSAYLVGEGALFTTPTIGGIDVNSSADVTGWTNANQDLPVCVSATPIPLCEPQTKLDTFRFSLMEDTDQLVCLDAVLNLPDTVGSVQICQQGQGVSALVSQGSSCLTLSPSPDFVGNDTLCVVHCSAAMADFCDTTYIIVTVERAAVTCDVVLSGVSPSSLPTCGESNGILDVNATGSNLQYSLDNGISYQNTSLFSNLAAGIYTIRIRDSVSTTCTDTLVYAFLGIAQPTINSVAATVPSACNASDGSIRISASGGSNLRYSIDGGQTYAANNIFNNLSAGTYYIFVSNNAGSCVEEYGFNPIIFTPCTFECTVSTGSDLSICAGDSVSLLATGNGNQYSWTPTTGLSCTDCPNPKAAPTTTTTYIVTSTNTTENCSSQDTVTISVNSLNFNVQTTHPAECGNTDGSITFQASSSGGALIYSIDGGNTWGSNNLFSGLGSGNYYTQIAFSDTSCVSDVRLISLLNLINTIDFTVQSSDPTTCDAANGSISINAGRNGLIYSIDNGLTWIPSNTFTGLGQGNYSVLVADSDTSCVSNAQVVALDSPSAPVISAVNVSDPTACNTANGSISINADRNGLIYSIDNGLTWSTNNAFTGLGQGSYSALVADSDTSCVSNAQVVTLNSPSAPIISAVNVSNPAVCGMQNGSIEIIASGSSPLEYSINNGVNWQNNNVFNNLGGGLYTVLVRYQNGTCPTQYNSTVELTVPNTLSILTPIDNIANCADNSIPLSITLNENITSYAVNSGNIVNENLSGATLTFDALLSGEINEFSITFSNGTCEITETFVIYRTLNIEADFVVIEPFCKEMEVAIRFTGNASASAQLQWELDGGILLNSSLATATNPTGSEIVVRWNTEGSKLIRLTLIDGGCTDEQYESIFVRKLPLVNAGPDKRICGNECAELEGSGTGVWYTWSPADGLSATDIPNPVACPNQTTTYTLTVMSADGCVAVDQVTVFVENSFASIIADTEICAGESTILGADGGISYLWSPAASLNDPTAATPIATPSVTTTYTVIVTNANGCIDQKSVRVTVRPAPEAIACADKTICRGDSIQLVVDAHLIYAWSPANSLLNPNTGTPTAFPTETTTYTVTVTDENGCTDTDEVTIYVNDPIAANAGPDVSICEGTSTQLQATGGTHYQWQPAIGLNAANIPNPVAFPLVTTTYTVLVTGADGCTDTDEVTVFVNQGAGINAGADQTICEGESVQLNATGGSNYQWQPAVGLSTTNIPNPIVIPNISTAYIVSGMGANGCVDTDTVIVYVIPKPEAIACDDKAICRGESIQLVVTTHSSYAWSPANSLLNPNTGTPTAFPTETTTYTVTVTDENGCTDTDEVTVYVNNPIAANAGPDVSICEGTSTQLQATGGTHYQWQPAIGLNAVNIPNPVAFPLVTTTYTVLVTGADGCTDTDEVTIFVNQGAGINAGADRTICEGESVQLNATGGSSYQWQPAVGLSTTNIPNPIVTPNISTAYIVSGVGANGCLDTDTLIVYVIPKPEAVACDDKTICRGESIQLVVTTHSSYAWSPTNSLLNPNTGTPTAFPTETTTYTVTVTDENGCTDTDEVVVFVNEPTVDLGPDINLCQGDFVQLNATGGVTYLWTPAIGLNNPNIPNPIASPAQTTTYSVLVTDEYGCTATDEITINLKGMIADAGPMVVICPGESGQLNASGGVSYSWSPTTGLSNPNIANPIVTIDQMTTYTVTVTDENGCTDTDETKVVVSLPFMVDATITPAGCCGGGGSVVLNVSGGYGNTNFEWTPNVSSTNSAFDLDAGRYKVSITDAQGCGMLYVINIEEDCDDCEAIFPEKEICIEDTVSIARVCVPISPSDIKAYEVKVDGLIYTPSHGCDFENFLAYSYALVEGRGASGNYQITSWTVNGETFSGQVENMQQLTNWMNMKDPGGNWNLNAGILSITGGNPTKNYGNIEIVQLDKWVETTMSPSITGLATSSVVEVNLENGTRHEIVITDTLTCCSDTLIVKRCEQEQPCVDDIINRDIFKEVLMNCDDLAAICLEIPFENSLNYQIEVNNAAYAGLIAACDNGAGMQLSFGLGQHQVTLSNKVNGCEDRFTVNVLCAEDKIVERTIKVGEKGRYCLAEIINDKNNVGNITTATITCSNMNNPAVLFLPAGGNCYDYQGQAVGSDTLCLMVCTDLELCFHVQMIIHVLVSEPEKPDEACENFISENSLSASLSDCDSLAVFCIDIPFDSIGLYTITQNENAFEGALSGCESGTYIALGLGTHQLLFQHQQRNCIDSLTLTVNCITNPSYWTDTIEVGEQLTFCPEPDELIGEIQSIQNICSNQSGIAVNFATNDALFCLNYEGITEGDALACLVLCDELDVCDTIYFNVFVKPEVLKNPIAITDIDTTEENKAIAIDVLANDFIFGNPTNLEVLAEPAHGTVAINLDNTITFTPADSYCDSGTPETFMYGVCNANGCDTAIVEVWIPCQEMRIFNGFSPNNDGVNDFFRIQGVQAFPNNHLKVFNRWGTMVFSQKGYKNRWDGTWENKNLPDGAYFYIFDDGKGKNYSGYLQIVR